MLLLKCDCGGRIRLRPGQLPANKTKSCGCLVSSHFDKKFKEKYPIDTVFGSLTVKGYDIAPRQTKTRNGSVTERRIVCKCACGKTTSVRASSAARGHTASCGCIGIKKRTDGRVKRYTLPPVTVAMHAALSHLKSCASYRGIVIDLTAEEFDIISKTNCHYCGAAPDQATRTKKATYIRNGIDRVDSRLGYVHSNCVSCCKHCNYAKRKMSVLEFKDWLRRAATHFLGMA